MYAIQNCSSFYTKNDKKSNAKPLSSSAYRKLTPILTNSFHNRKVLFEMQDRTPICNTHLFAYTHAGNPYQLFYGKGRYHHGSGTEHAEFTAAANDHREVDEKHWACGRTCIFLWADWYVLRDAQGRDHHVLRQSCRRVIHVGLRSLFDVANLRSVGVSGCKEVQ